LLAQFEEMQRMHIADRDRLRAKLAATDQTADTGAPAASRDALTAGTNSPVRI
jgi:hypothetical protein